MALLDTSANLGPSTSRGNDCHVSWGASCQLGFTLKCVPSLISSGLPGKLSLAVSTTTTTKLAHAAICTAVLDSLLLPLRQVAHGQFT